VLLGLLGLLGSTHTVAAHVGWVYACMYVSFCFETEREEDREREREREREEDRE
jgi:hypothetical protein